MSSTSCWRSSLEVDHEEEPFLAIFDSIFVLGAVLKNPLASVLMMMCALLVGVGVSLVGVRLVGVRLVGVDVRLVASFVGSVNS